MQKVTAILPSWDKTKTSSKSGFDKGWKLLDKIGAPVNKLSNKVGSEAFWPTSMDKESDKAARILKSFCKDGFYVEEDRPSTTQQDGAKGKQRVLKKIPQRVIRNAVGLAIFTTMRTGLWVSGAGGSGVLIARKEDGTWSPPSGILLHTAGLGFLVGVDIYDCVVVINNRRALESFTKIRATLGGEISAVAGPVGVGGVLENDGRWKQANRPVFTYLKSRGFYAGVQVDGTVIIERTDENERFYGERIGVADILAGKARHPPYEIKMLIETVKAAEGRLDVDHKMLDTLNGPAPADNELSSPTDDIKIFGVPEADDPDPFGVLALEKEGLEIREAGTKERPLSNQFEFNPSPTSPVYGKFHHNRQSIDTMASRSNRESYMSTRSTRTRNSIDRSTQTEMGTQTDEVITPITSPTHSSFDHARIDEVDEKAIVATPDEIDYTKIDLGPYSHLNRSQDFDGTTAVSDSPPPPAGVHSRAADSTYASDEDEFDDEDEEPVVFEAGQAQAVATVITPQALGLKGGVVNIPKRGPPPPLPPRSSARNSRVMVMVDQSSGRSPTKEGFEEVEVHGGERMSGEKRRSRLAEPPVLAEELEAHVARVPESPNGLGITMTDLEEDAREEGEINVDEKTTTTDPSDPANTETLAPEKHETKTIVDIPDLVQPAAVQLEELAEKKAENEIQKVKDLNPLIQAPELELLKPESEDDTFHSLPTTPAPIDTIEVK